MAERTTEQTWNPNTNRMDTREVYAKQEQGKYEREASDADAKQGVKALFKKEAPKPPEPPQDNSLGAAAARARKRREELAKAEGQKVALSK